MKKYFPPLVLIALVLLVYGNTLQNSFHYDDEIFILKRPWIRGLDKIPQFIFSYRERPLVILSFNINYAISRFDAWSYHAFNILAHLGATLLVYRLACLSLSLSDRYETCPGRTRRSFPKIGAGGGAPEVMPFLAALLFALHPLNTQAVTYISSRSALMATFFYLATLIFLFEGASRWPGRRPETTRSAETALDPSRSQSKLSPPGRAAGWSVLFFLASAVCLACGALSKEIVVTLPAMALLFHFYFMSPLPFGRWLAKNLKWILALAAALAVGMVYKFVEAGKFLPASPTPFSASSYFLTQTFVIPFEYFWKMFFPVNLSIDNAFPLVSDWRNFSSYLGLLVLTAYTAVLALVSRRQPWMGFGMAWAIVAILPESSFIPLLDMETEHRTYLPLAGFSIFAASALRYLASGLREGAPVPGVSRIPVAGTVRGAVSLILVFFAAGTIDRNAVWKNPITLWEDAKKKAPRLIRPYNNLGEAYDKLKLYDLALAEFEAALKIDPNYFFALSNIANIYGKKEQPLRAIEYLEKALAVKPDYAAAYYNLAKAWHLMGERQKALEYYRKAILHDNYFEEAYYNLGFLALEMGLHDEAIQNFSRLLEMQPANRQARFALGISYAQSRQYDLALAQYQKVVEQDPDYFFPYINIGTIYMQTGRYDEAIAVYRKILDLHPEIGGIYKNLGKIYLQYKNDPAQALYYFEESLRLEPKQPEAAVIRGIVAELRTEVGATAHAPPPPGNR